MSLLLSLKHIDYASCLLYIDDSKLVDMSFDYTQKRSLNEQILDRAFKSKFGTYFKEVNYDGSHQMVIVASELDASSERISNRLNDMTEKTSVVHRLFHLKKRKKNLCQNAMVNIVIALMPENMGRYVRTTIVGNLIL